MKHTFKTISWCLAGLFSIATVSAAPVLPFPDQQNQSVNRKNANAYLEIDVQAFEKNLATLQTQLAGKSKICAVMKADAYGNGIHLLMPSIIKMNIPCVGIASNEEARAVRSHGYQG